MDPPTLLAQGTPVDLIYTGFIIAGGPGLVRHFPALESRKLAYHLHLIHVFIWTPGNVKGTSQCAQTGNESSLTLYTGV